MYRTLILLSFTVPLTVLGCSHHSITSTLCVENSCPSGTPVHDQIVDHKITLLANNARSKFADWVAYRVEQRFLNGSTRERNWKKDPDLPENATLSPSDYTGAHDSLHTDRGHQAPLASFKGASNYYVVNYLSNITPQKSILNQDAWAKLEEAVRTCVKNHGSVYVVTGPYYGKNQHPEPSLPHYNGTVMIPEGYFKVVASESKNGIAATAFLMPQGTPKGFNYCKAITSLSKIKKLTGLTVLPQKPVGNLNKWLNC